MAIGGKIPNFQEGIHLQYIHRPFRTHHVSLEGNWKISPNVLEIDQLLNDYTSLSPPQKKVYCNLIFLGQSCNLSSCYHHHFGDFKFQFAQKKTQKNTNPEFPCALQPKLLNLKWTRSAAEILLHAGLDISQVVASYQNSQKKKGDQGWGKSSQKKCRMGNVETEEKFWELSTSSSKIVRVLCSGLSCWTTEPRNKTGLTFHWILVGLIGILIYTYIMVPHTTGYDFIPHIYTKPPGSPFFHCSTDESNSHLQFSDMKFPFRRSVTNSASRHCSNCKSTLIASVITGPQWQHFYAANVSCGTEQNWYYGKNGNHKQIYLLHGASCF